ADSDRVARATGRTRCVASSTGNATMKLEGRVALVTGGGIRVGRALAVALGRERMRVAVHYYASSDGAKGTARAIEAAGGQAALFEDDLTSHRGPSELVQKVAAKFGSLAVVVNSA